MPAQTGGFASLRERPRDTIRAMGRNTPGCRRPTGRPGAARPHTGPSDYETGAALSRGCLRRVCAGPPDYETVGRNMSDGHRPTDAPAPSRRSGPGRRVEAVRKNGGSRSDRTERPSRALRSTPPDPPAAPTRRKPAGQTSPAGHVPARAHGSPPPRSFDRTVRHDAGRVRRPTPWHLWMRAFRNPAIRSKCMPGWLPPDGAWACRGRGTSRPRPLFRPQPARYARFLRPGPRKGCAVVPRHFCALWKRRSSNDLGFTRRNGPRSSRPQPARYARFSEVRVGRGHASSCPVFLA